MSTIDRDLGEINGKLGLILEGMKAQWDAHGKLEKRVRGVENKQHWYAGAAALAAAAITHLGTPWLGKS